jgi:hypothetical protein
MKGSCNCTKISFEISNEITGVYQCHCKLCQKQSGSTSNTASIINESDFTWLSGESFISHWKKESGFTSHFCNQCGCPVPNRLRDSHFYWIPMGLVDDNAIVDIKIVAHLCCSSKASFDLIQDDADNYDDMPNDLEHFIKTLKNAQNKCI